MRVPSPTQAGYSRRLMLMETSASQDVSSYHQHPSDQRSDRNKYFLHNFVLRMIQARRKPRRLHGSYNGDRQTTRLRGTGTSGEQVNAAMCFGSVPALTVGVMGLLE